MSITVFDGLRWYKFEVWVDGNHIPNAEKFMMSTDYGLSLVECFDRQTGKHYVLESHDIRIEQTEIADPFLGVKKAWMMLDLA